MNINDRIFCRDPFILPFKGKYYLYRSIDSSGLKSKGVEVLTSIDLQEWSEPKIALAFNGTEYKDYFWAPECHFYNGEFYIFSSLYCNDCGHRRIGVFKSKKPDEDFKFVTFISPDSYDAIDGTLYIDKNNDPWLVFVHEWTSMPNGIGGMCGVRVSSDLSKFLNEPLMLFYADAPTWHTAGVTDGPFLIRYDENNLFMIWSNFCKDGYVIALAKSTNGEITGEWIQKDIIYKKDLKPFMKYDGGHAMHFKTFDGKDKIVFHSPNGQVENVREALTIRDLIISKDKIEIV